MEIIANYCNWSKKIFNYKDNKKYCWILVEFNNKVKLLNLFSNKLDLSKIEILEKNEKLKINVSIKNGNKKEFWNVNSLEKIEGDKDLVEINW